MSKTRLEISEVGINLLLAQHVNNDTLLLVDRYCHELLCGSKANIKLVENNEFENLKIFSGHPPFTRIVSIGGCTVQDVARAIAFENNADLICIPSILSTSCLSSDRSVLSINGEQEVRKYRPALLTLVDIAFLKSTKPLDLFKWTTSGLGDLLSNISATIDYSYRQGRIKEIDLSLVNPDAISILHWVVEVFSMVDEECLKKVAIWSHQSSIQVIQRDSLELNTGGEHELYYSLRKLSDFEKISATHGQIVAIGSILNIYRYSELIGDFLLFDLFRIAFRKLRFPLKQSELYSLGLSKEIILDAVSLIPVNYSLLSFVSVSKTSSIIDKIFLPDYA